MEVIKSVIREASGQTVDLRCGLKGRRGRGGTSDGFARKFLPPCYDGKTGYKTVA
jgi:hypothetical protein